MALSECRECSNLVSSEAAACPRCGCPAKPTVTGPSGKRPQASTSDSDENTDTDVLDAVNEPPTGVHRRPPPRPQVRAGSTVPFVPPISPNGPLLQRSGILVTRSLIDLHGRSYSVPQLNSIKVTPATHPLVVPLTLVVITSFLVGGIILAGVALALLLTDTRGDGFYLWCAIAFVIAVVCLAPGFFAIRAVRKLPPWALLRFQMSSGDVKALMEDRVDVEAVAAAIRLAMASR